MKYVWQDLPEKKNCFTVRNTTMINLNTGKTVQHYSTNTKIVLAQKCVTPDKTYYRTAEAAHHYLNYAFEAEAFGLPNEKAPSAPTHTFNSKIQANKGTATRTQKPAKKQTSDKKAQSPKGGGGKGLFGWIKKLFRSENG